MLDHPEVVNAMQTGYPSWNQEQRSIGKDSLGVEIFEGDEIYELEDERFVAEDLTYNAVEVLELLGAVLTIAK